MRLFFPTCNDTYVSYDALAHFWAKAIRVTRDVPLIVDFTRCDELRPMGLVVFAGLVHHLRSRGVNVTFALHTMQAHVFERFSGSGCAHHLLEGRRWDNDTLFRHDLVEDKNGIIAYLEDQWFGLAGLTMSPLLQNEFISTLWEIYANAFEHGDSSFGVFTCGEQISNHTLLLTVADFGPGIPYNCASALTRHRVSGEEALRWAFTKGTTTSKNQRYPRGLGLDLLKEFVWLNNGALEIYSHHGHGRVTHSEEVFRTLQLAVGATIVQMKINCDKQHYVFASELPDSGAPLF